MSENNVEATPQNTTETPKHRFMREKIKGRMIFLDQDALDRISKDIGSLHLCLPEAIWEIFLTRDHIVFERYATPNPRQAGIGMVGDEPEERREYPRVPSVFYLTERRGVVAQSLEWEKLREFTGVDALYTKMPPHDQIQIREVWCENKCVRHTDLLIIDAEGKPAYRRKWPVGFSKEYSTAGAKVVATCYYNEKSKCNTTAAYCKDLNVFKVYAGVVKAFVSENSNKGREKFK